MGYYLKDNFRCLIASLLMLISSSGQDDFSLWRMGDVLRGVL